MKPDFGFRVADFGSGKVVGHVGRDAAYVTLRGNRCHVDRCAVNVTYSGQRDLHLSFDSLRTSRLCVELLICCNTLAVRNTPQNTKAALRRLLFETHRRID